MNHPTIAFVGAGNMASALIGGLIADGTPPERLIAADADPDRLAALSGSGVRLAPDNETAAREAGLLVLAVKPQVLEAVCRELAPALAERRPLVVSVAAGVRVASLQRWLGGRHAVVRCMPNTPAMVQAGATALYASPEVSAEQREQAETVLRAVGLVQWIDDEELMDAVTALSGSGPAYFFRFMEAMERAGERMGLPADTARLLTLQTALGAAKMAIESREDPAELRRRVTSPGGTTERALAVFEDRGLEALVEQALDAARDRSRELSRLLDAED